MLGFGAAALALSILYTHMLLAFIGLGLAFWGAILLYIQPEDYTRKAVMDASLLPPLATLNQTLQELDYRGDAAYLPPKYFANPENTRVYVAKQKDLPLPSPEQIQKNESQLFLRDPQGVLLTPPGAELLKLFERTLETNFTKVDLEYLQQNMPRLFIENLEIAENLEIETANSTATTKAADSVSVLQAKNDTIHVRITSSIFNQICRETANLPYTSEKIGCPLCSAIACALTKATGEPIIIENTQQSVDGKTTEVTYRIVTAKPQEQAEQVSAKPLEKIESRHNRFINLANALLILSGSTILAWISWLTWYDMTALGKSIALIFFGSRAGEIISLGIDMRIIYYFLIGLALLLSGLIVLARKRKHEKKRPCTMEQAQAAYQ